ncbi:MAG TPA: ferritin-like domain-containing protein [Streptosporangiaceae bacterium]|nr:ferritin-like domain-containing protein [Streptosporangiaceae bacterium]
MTERHAPSSSPGGRGRLAQVIATRGGLAPPEAPFVIEHREALIYMLCEAAELEHGIMCQYLYAAFSLKQSEAEGLTATELEAVQRWRKQISHVATQEMLHLSLVQNLLSAIGCAPHLSRSNFPHPASNYPAGVHLALVPFGETALQHFMFLERPEGMDLDDAQGMAAFGRARPAMQKTEIVARGQDFATVGHLYRSIEAGIAHLADKFGERWLFVGPPRAQATEQYFVWPELVAVTDVASAQQAIDEILEQGEGPRGDWKDAHFGQFVEILDEYTQLRDANPAFDPVRPVVTVNVRPAVRETDIPLVTDPLTRQVMDLFNVAYEILLLMLQRFFVHTEETDAQLKALADATVALMYQAIKPLGDLVTTLPAGPDYPGRTAGPSFELFYETDYVLPHREAAWILLTHRIRQAADFCEPGMPCAPQVAGDLDAVKSSLTGIAEALEAHMPARDVRPAAPAPAPPDVLPALLARADDIYRTTSAFTGHPNELLSHLGDAVRSTYQAVLAHQDDSRVVARLVDSVLRPLGQALNDVSAAHHIAPVAPIPAEPAPAPTADDPLWDAAHHVTRLRAQFANHSPDGLLEAAAALQHLACDRASPGERARRIAVLADLQKSLRPAIVVAENGPYLVTNVPVRDHLGERLTVPPQVAFCRCGASSMKPFCDGTHATNGFTGAKDPDRVPDRRDTYPGQQVTIFDNRGICQHAGLCTDRLPTAFRTDKEPFVAPSGARMDELVRAVRDCPSGALSLAFDGEEARGLADWHGRRERAIEITQDGPYRVTGGVPLAGAASADLPRADVPRVAGSSREHYALCRCGHSQNKPFCSGAHWYAGFRDPVRPPGAEPSLFDWAGGLPALTRMTRLLYEKHVPADDLLAPLFAAMPPDQPQREAAVLAEAFGGPARDSSADLRQDFTEPQRARWVALATRAADEAMLPADPAFRAALSSYLEWSSHANGTTPLPWDWSPAGPPAEEPAQASTDTTEEVTLPGPDETVSFEANVKPLFREKDRQSMARAFDLWSRDDVQAHAAAILTHLSNGTMPCDGAWPPEKVEVFRRWTESGFQP